MGTTPQEILERAAHPLNFSIIPEKLKCSILNFNISSPDEEGQLGVWQFLKHGVNACRDTRKSNITEFEEALKTSSKIIVFLHDRGKHRADANSIEKCLKLAELGYTVLSMDYRGFGDSDGEPMNEEGLFDDVFALFAHVNKSNSLAKFILYGHGLGGGIIGGLLKTIRQNNLKIDVDGVILDSTFTNARDAFINHSSVKILESFIIAKQAAIVALKKCRIYFDNEMNFEKIDIPVLLLHAEDDNDIPFIMADQLYRTLQKNSVNVTLVKVKAKEGSGHMDIHKSVNFLTSLRDWLQRIELDKYHE